MQFLLPTLGGSWKFRFHSRPTGISVRLVLQIGESPNLPDKIDHNSDQNLPKTKFLAF